VPVLLGVIVILLSALLVLSVKAFATPTASPSFTKAQAVTQADFVIPKHSHATWSLKLWSHGRLLGVSKGTSGTLSIALPTRSCTVQADVRTTSTGGSTIYYSGNRAVSVCCPPSSTGGVGGVTTSVTETGAALSK
jgi:hypothetical protein